MKYNNELTARGMSEEPEDQFVGELQVDREKLRRYGADVHLRLLQLISSQEATGDEVPTDVTSRPRLQIVKESQLPN